MADWTQAADDRLRALWDEGHPGGEIARRMDRSKNAIVGRAHRLKLPRRPSPIVAGPATLADAQRATLRGLVARGFGTKAIAALMHVPRGLVRREMVRLGLALQPSGGGAAASRRARESTETLRAEAFRRHAQPGGGASPVPAAHSIPASAGDPVRPGHAEASAGCAEAGVSSLTLPPAVVFPRPAVLSSPGGARPCRWPMWGDDDRATQEFCGAPVRQRRDGAPCTYCAVHAARAFSRVAEPVEEAPHRVTRSTFAWGGRAA